MYQHGNLACAAMLLDRYQQPLLGYLRRLSGSPEDAEDLLQDVFLKVHEARESFAGRGAFAGWLYRIATHECYNHLKRKRRLENGRMLNFDEQAPAESEPPVHQVHNVHDVHETPREALSSVELAAHIEQAITALPLPYRTIFLLRQKQELSYEQIAAILNEPEGRLRVQFHRARQMLFSALAPYLPDKE